MDPAYEKISRRISCRTRRPLPTAFAKRLVQAHPSRHGPARTYLGLLVKCRAVLIWQDPIPPSIIRWSTRIDMAALKETRPASGLSMPQLVRTAWASASTYPRQRQARRRQWRAHPPRAAEGLGGQPAGRARPPCSATLEAIRRDFNASAHGRQEDLACRPDRARRLSRRWRHAASRAGGAPSACPSHPAAWMPSAEQTDVESPSRCSSRVADGFRNYLGKGHDSRRRPRTAVDRAAAC